MPRIETNPITGRIDDISSGETEGAIRNARTIENLVKLLDQKFRGYFDSMKSEDYAEPIELTFTSKIQNHLEMINKLKLDLFMHENRFDEEAYDMLENLARTYGLKFAMEPVLHEYIVIGYKLVLKKSNYDSSRKIS